MALDSKNWRDKRPGPLQDTQPRNISFAEWTGASKGRPQISNSRIQLKVPERKQSNLGNQPSWNGGQSVYARSASGKSRGVQSRSQASNWDAQKPEVLFNDHSEHLLKHEYKRGMIINAPVHEAMSMKGRTRAPSHFESISAWGGVYTKPRYLIIVALHETEYTSIPLYSHNQEGLRGKEHYRNEFVSIRDGRLSGSFTAQSELKPLVAEMSTGPGIDPTTVAWLTHPVSRKYDLNLSVCGRLKQESLDLLITYMEAETRRGLGIA